MSELGDDYRAIKEHNRRLRETFGVPCPVCTVKLPKAQPKILMPRQKCWCGYRDIRQERY